MVDNLSITAKRCMDTIKENVGIVELEAFIYYVERQNFDYTEWQREHYDSMTAEKIQQSLAEYSASHDFHGRKAEII